MALVDRKSFVVQEVAKIKSIMLFRIQSHRVILLRLAVILGVLAAGPIVGVLVVRMNWEYVLIAIIVPLFLLVLQRLDLAPLIILIAAAFVRFELSTGTESKLVASLLLTMFLIGAWVLRMLIVEKRLWLKPSPVNKPLLGFMFITLFSLVWSVVFRDPLVVIWKSFPFVQLASAIVMIMLPGAFLLVANFLNDVKRLKAMVVIMLIAGVLGVAKRLGQVDIPVNTEGLFTMWIIALSAGLALFNNRLPLIVRGLLMVLTGYWVYWGFNLHISWLAGWLPGFVALGVLAFMRSKKLALTLLIFVVIFVAANSNYYLESVIQDEQESSGQYRVAAWEVNWRVTGKHVLFGTGPAGYAAYYMSYFPHDAMATHSNYIDILAQTGIIGFGLCVWFFIALAWMGYKLCLRLRGQGDFREGLANAALAGTIACIVIMAFGDWLFPFAYTQSIAGFSYAVYSWLFMGTILALEGLTRTEPGVMEDA